MNLIGYVAPNGYLMRVESSETLSSQPGIVFSPLTLASTTAVTYEDETVFIGATLPISSTEISTNLNTQDTKFIAQVYSDVSYIKEAVIIKSIVPSVERKVKLSLTCTHGGTAVITHILKPHGSEPLPAWVTINSTTDELTFTPPGLFAPANYTFIVESVVSSATQTYVQKLVTLEVLPLV